LRPYPEPNPNSFCLNGVVKTTLVGLSDQLGLDTFHSSRTTWRGEMVHGGHRLRRESFPPQRGIIHLTPSYLLLRMTRTVFTLSYRVLWFSLKLHHPERTITAISLTYLFGR